jgi:flavin reductase (DIM6/NTAB) family NADH-FMN oxidoreductase RutF
MYCPESEYVLKKEKTMTTLKSNFKSITPNEIIDNPFTAIDKDWMLITAGNQENHTTFNTMTASWGGWGILWHKPVSYIFVRPTRHTYHFTEENDLYTLSFFDDTYREALKICGTKSGKDGDKVGEAGLTPITFDEGPGAVAFAEARLVMVCKKLYWQDILPQQFLDPGLDKNYPKKDYHRMYVGEIIGTYIK